MNNALIFLAKSSFRWLNRYSNFLQIPVEVRLGHAVVTAQLRFCIAPEGFDPVDVVASAAGELVLVIDAVMAIPVRDETVIDAK